MTFEQFGLKPEILKGVESRGYKKATPIQAQAIPVILDGKDLLGGAQTGTGKTAAFALPILDRLSRSKTETAAPRALILTPTRELADQVGESFITYGKYLDLSTTKIYGGVKMNPQITNLKAGTDIVIATPGRLMDHLEQKNIDLSNIKILVLDEADRMLDMGFINDIKKIAESIPYKRQNLLFSATYGSDIENLASVILNNPVAVEVTKRNAAAEEVEQIVHFVDKKDRFDLLSHLITEGSWYQVLIFVKTKHGAERLNSQLLKAGIPSSAIHGDKSQGARSRALKEFKSGDLQALVATDVAARGIDLDNLSHVVNFELPQIPEDYIHRIGRTGRAGKSGIAISLVSFSEKTQLKKIEKILKAPIPQAVIEGFEPKHDIDKVLNKNKGRNKNMIPENKSTRGTKVKTIRTARSNNGASTTRKRTDAPSSQPVKKTGKPRFKSTRSNDQHGGRTTSEKPFKSIRNEKKRGGNSRPEKEQFKSGRSENKSRGKNRSARDNFKSGKPGNKPRSNNRSDKEPFKFGKSENKPVRGRKGPSKKISGFKKKR